ncbi:MAG: CBS domain-containing protein [Chitinivibrionales bacterium]
MNVRDCMTPNAEGIQSTATVKQAAHLMANLDVGVLPVFEGNRDSGIITDRDIVIRTIAGDLNPSNTSVGEVMSKDVLSCREDDSLETAAKIMENNRVRRLLVKDSSGLVTGVISLGDIAVRGQKAIGEEILQKVSQPSEPAR